MSDHPTLTCSFCGQPMQLVRTIPAVGPAWPALLAFYCAQCQHAETMEEESGITVASTDAHETAKTQARRASDFR